MSDPHSWTDQASRRVSQTLSCLQQSTHASALGTIASNWTSAEERDSSFSYTSLLTNKTRKIGLPVITPTYDRSKIKCGIVQFGVGGFHRAHLAYNMDALLHQHDAEPLCRDWGICGVSVREADRNIHNAMIAQNCYYTLIARGSRSDDVEIRIIGSVLDYVFAPDTPEAVKARLMSPDTKIVSLTITEGGYDVMRNPEVLSDMQQMNKLMQPDTLVFPKSVFGWIVMGLIWRHQAGLKPYTVLSCDNLLHNGDVTKACLMRVLSSTGSQQLIQTLQSIISCPNSMVDRITPVTMPRDIAMVRDRYGILDQWPILCEKWAQWVIEKKEDGFPSGLPPLHLLSHDSRYNLLICDDVKPYENMKLRLLNATHTAVCYLGHLAGYDYVDQIMNDSQFREFAQRFMTNEVRPSLPQVPNVDLDAYQASVIDRFANPHVKDTTLRICMDGANKFPKFILDTLRAQIASIHKSDSQNPLPIHCISLVIASWFRFLSGENAEGQAIPISDPVATQLGLVEAARTSRADVTRLFALARPVFEECVTIRF